MHEMSIASSIIDVVRNAESEYHGHITKVGLRLGELAGIDESSLQFCFDSLVRETDLEPVTLEISYCKRQNRCRSCRNTFEVADWSFECPDCGARDTEPVAGDELEVAYLELEEK